MPEKPERASAARFEFDGAVVDTAARQLLVGGRAASLGARAFDVLVTLIERRERVVAKDELLDAVWPGLIVEENNLQVQVWALRKLLGPATIATIPGRGYRFTGKMKCVEGDPQPSGATGVAASEVSGAQHRARTNLATMPTEIFGREADVAALLESLGRSRLVTVVGPGGIGKTRLAFEVARRTVSSDERPVWWVDLGAVSSPDLLAPAIAAATNIRLTERDPISSLVHGLAETNALLVLDSCEQLSAPLARIVGAGLQSGSGLSVLATSQLPLGVAGERLYRLEPLAVPPPGTAVDAALQFGALALLRARAAAVDRRFVLDATNVVSAIELCGQLDGLPLAIEMAGARLPAIGFEGLRSRLGDRLRLLRNPGEAPHRQRTLQATLEWSHSLLNERERAVLRRLAAFCGSFSLESAQHVAAGVRLDPWDALDALMSLVDRSLVQVIPPEPPRYRLLETVRLFAEQRLSEAGEAAAVCARHGEALARRADELLQVCWTVPERDWLAAYAGEKDDLGSAFESACERHDADTAALTGEVIVLYDVLRGARIGIRRRKQMLRSLLPAASPVASAHIWNTLARYPTMPIEGLSRTEVVRERLKAWQAAGDARQVYLALTNLATDCARNGDLQLAQRALEEAERLPEAQWPAGLRAWASRDATYVSKWEDNAASTKASAERALQWALKANSRSLAAEARSALADAALSERSYEEAFVLAGRSAEELEALDLTLDLILARSNLCLACLMLGRLGDARNALRKSLPLAWRHEMAGYQFDHLAHLAVCSGRSAQAARLLGFSDRVYRDAGTRRQPNEARLADLTVDRLLPILGPSDLQRLREDGGALQSERARAIADAELMDQGFLADL